MLYPLLARPFSSQNSHSDYSAEMHRHNIAMEKLSKAREHFYEDEVKRREKLEELRREIEEAKKDIDLTNEELESYKEKIKLIQNRRKPVLSDFYTPSKEFQNYIYIFNIMIAGGAGYGVYKLVEYEI